MKVILNQTVPKVGKEGQVVNVADGYARNYLFPRKLAVVADRAQVRALERRNERIAAKLEGTRAAADALKEKLDGKTVKIVGKVGRDAGKLFGAITAQDIATAVKEQLGQEVEKKQVGVLEPIKRLGHFQIALDLHRDVDAFIDVHVYDPDAPEEPVEVAPEPVQEVPETVDEE